MTNGKLNIVSGYGTIARVTPSPQMVVKDRWIPGELAAQLKGWSPRSELGKIIRRCFAYLPAHLAGELLDRISSTLVIESSLALVAYRSKDRYGDRGITEDYGVVGHKVVTTAGVNFLVDAWQNSVELEILKYHGIGTGSTAEASGDTALVTELTTEYNPDSTRATGTLTEGASANIFRTVGTNTLDGTPGAALREHGLFSAATAGTLWDRTVYASITLNSGDSLQSTYDMTATAGG